MRALVSLLTCSALTVLGCGGGDLTLPGHTSILELTPFSGDGQEAAIGSRLPKPLVVLVTDERQEPVTGVRLVFRFQEESPDAAIDPASVQTDKDGHASVRVQLGQATGSQIIEAGLAEDASAEPVTFEVTAVEEDHHGKRGHEHGHH
jgi:hypothetical protein